MNNKNTTIDFTTAEIKNLQKYAVEKGYKSAAAYLMSLHQKHLHVDAPTTFPKKPKIEKLNRIHKTRRGEILHGDSLNWLLNPKNKGTVDLVMTSPPFGLIRKKAYGNEADHAYCAWFRQFAEGFVNVLKDEGSLVIDIAGTWERGYPARSLYHFDVLTMLCREYGFNLCQEHYWWNPSKLPSPAQWVNVKRSRVKDSVNCIWWLSKSKNPKADNTKILTPYSKGMQSLLKNGYTATKKRPSGHSISGKFSKDNGGSIPPNLLAIANTESRGSYWNYCNEVGLDIHPARFPQGLPEYFIKFLTDEGDLVVDPFGGSSMTGYVAENLGRKWRCIEMDEIYALGGVGRFIDASPYKSDISKYEIFSPGRLLGESE